MADKAKEERNISYRDVGYRPGRGKMKKSKEEGDRRKDAKTREPTAVCRQDVASLVAPDTNTF